MLRSIKYWIRTGAGAQILGYLLRPGLIGWPARLFNAHGTIRIVSYHDVTVLKAAQFDEHMRFFEKHFRRCTIADFERYLRGEKLQPGKPLLLLTFDDGLRSHYETVAPILEKWGFGGLFLVPTEFLSSTDQQEYVKQHHISSASTYPDGRLSMTAHELRDLARKHRIVCHTHTHRRLGAEVPANEVRRELEVSTEALAQLTGREVDGFAWVGGEMASYSRQAARTIKDLGFHYALITKPGLNTRSTDRFELRRSPLHVSWPVSLVSFHLCGLFDLLYWRQKREISHLNNCLMTVAPVLASNSDIYCRLTP